MTYDEFLAEWHNDSPRVLVHTSGSTGSPKPLWVEKRRMEASARMTCRFLGLKPGDSALLCLPLDYIAGKMMVVRALVGGLRLIVIPPTGHPLAHLSEPVDFAAMIPLQVRNSIDIPEECQRLQQIRHLIVGGSAIDASLEAALAPFPHAVWSTYGMTETLSHIAMRRLNGSDASEWYTPLPGVTVTLDSDQCLVIDAPELASEKLTTNDRAVGLSSSPSIDGAGSVDAFRLLGRRDNVINSGGIKIQVEEIEAALRPHLQAPYMVTRCADVRLGQAVVLLTKGNAAEAEVLCRRHLPKYWQPRHYLAVARLPLTATGKPARHEAERLAAEHINRRTTPINEQQ